ncbi:hypothetical protein D3C81_1317480 [compost metagenome]
MRQHQDVLATVAQRRHLQVEHVQAVEQVFAEAAFGDHALQVAVGGADDAHIHLHFAVATHPAEAAIAEKTQQLGLQVWRHLADFIEKYRALVGQFHQPGLAAPLRAGEGAGGVAEQFALGQALGQRGAVQGQEWRRMAAADGVAGAGYQLFAGAGFAMHQQRCIERRHAQGAGLEGADGR